MTESRVRARKAKGICDDLGREVCLFLDSLRGMGALDVDELEMFTIESVQSPLLPAIR